MTRIEHSRLVLAVRDLEKSTRFFMDVLGCQRDFGDGSDGWSFLSRDNWRVMLGECPDERPAAEIGNHSYVAYLLVEGVDQLFSEFTSNGAPHISNLQDQPWGLREFGVETPDGHRLRFGQVIDASRYADSA